MKGKKTGGRQPNSINKLSRDLRVNITEFLTDHFDEVVEEWKKLHGRDKLNFYRDLLKFAVPQLQNISDAVNTEALTDEQVEQLYDRIIQNIDGDEEL